MKFLILPVAIAIISITNIDCESVLESDLSRYCFHAAIVIGVKKYAVSRFESDKTCSGAIISSTQIVTTLDCTRYARIPSHYIFPSNITVRAGSADRLSGGIVRYTKEVKRFDVGRGHYLAVITLDEPLEFGPTVCKIDMAREKDDKVFMKMGNSVEVCGYQMFSDFGRVKQLEAITSTIAHINPKCPVFHYVHQYLVVHGGPVIYRRSKDKKPLLLGIVSNGFCQLTGIENAVKISALSECITGESARCDDRCLIAEAAGDEPIGCLD